MKAIEMLRQQLDTVHIRLHHSAGDLTSDEMARRVLPGVNPLGFIVWHMARSQDWAINTAIRNVPEVITRVDSWWGRGVAPRIAAAVDPLARSD